MAKWEAEGQSLYEEMLLAARQHGLTLSRVAVRRIVARFDVVSRDIDELGAGTNALTAARGKALKAQVTGLLKALGEEVAKATADGSRLTVNRLVQLHQSTVGALETASGVVGISAAFDELSVRAVASLVQRTRNAAVFQTIVKRHLEAAAPALDEMIDSAVARGVSSRVLTNDIAQLLSGEDVAYATYDVTRASMEGLRSVYADARMIAVSEINNAMREANARLLTASLTVEAAKWSLSSAHPKVDACDGLAESDFYGYGPGIYPVQAWPFAPHPHCGCYQAGPIVFRPVSEWKLPRGVSRPMLDAPKLFAPTGLTENGAETAMATTKRVVSAAYGSPIR